MIRPLFAALCLLLALLPQPVPAKPTFRQTLDAHFKAVNDRDLDALAATLTAGNELTLILPNGKRTTTRAEFLDFHRTWFADRGWTMRFDVHRIDEAGTTAIAMVRTRYEEPGAAKPTWSESWLTLIFRREKGGWRLVHDQNTRIAASDMVAANGITGKVIGMHRVPGYQAFRSRPDKETSICVRPAIIPLS